MIDHQTASKLIRLQAKAKRRRNPAISLHGYAKDNQASGILASQIDIKYPEEHKTDHINRILKSIPDIAA